MSESISSAPVIGAPVQQPENRPQRPRSGKGWVWLLVLIVVAALAYHFWPKAAAGSNTGASNAPPNAGFGGRGGRGAGITPVVAARAKKGDASVYVEALGNVTSLYTVTIKSRVDGQLMQVFYKEGEIVQKDAPLAEIDTRPYQAALEQAEGQLLRDQALLANANVDLDRYAGLLKQNAVPEQQYATQKALVSQYEGMVKNDQGQVDAAKVNLVYCHITSPITGMAGLRLVDPGNIVHATDSMGLVVITQIQPISIVFTIPEDQLQEVLTRYHAGQRLVAEGWNRDKTKKIAEGALATIDNEIDQTTGTLRLRALYPNTNNALFPNEFVNVRLLIQEKHGVVLIPNVAVQLSNDTKFVYLVKPDSTVTVRNITTGASDTGQTEVVSGLAAGDVVVMQGVDKLNEGSKVIATIAGEQQPAGGRGGAGGAGGRSGPGAGRAGRGNTQ
jgi:multidrug efflux system membrane fusion protein